MRIIIFVISTLLLSACGNDTSNSNSENQKPTLAEEKTVTPSMKFPFDQSVQNFSENRVNDYGGGDCEGKIVELTNGTTTLGVDSLSCGEYGNEQAYYFFEKNKLQLVHSTSTQNLGNQVILSEKIYDLRAAPYLLFERSDTLTRSQNIQLQSAFSRNTFDDGLGAAKKIKSEYEQTFNRKSEVEE